MTSSLPLAHCTRAITRRASCGGIRSMSPCELVIVLKLLSKGLYSCALMFCSVRAAPTRFCPFSSIWAACCALWRMNPFSRVFPTEMHQAPANESSEPPSSDPGSGKDLGLWLPVLMLGLWLLLLPLLVPELIPPPELWLLLL